MMNNTDTLARAVNKDTQLSPAVSALRLGPLGQNVSTVNGDFWKGVQDAVDRVGVNTLVDILASNQLGLLIAQAVEAKQTRQVAAAPANSEAAYLDSLIVSLQARRQSLG